MTSKVIKLRRMKNNWPFLLSFLTLILLLFLVNLFNQPSAPVFSAPSGFHNEAFELTIETVEQNVVVHYTLDGSIPTLDSPVYSEPILIEDRSNEPSSISLIPTISYRYIEPNGEVFKITTIRARSFNQITKAASSVATQTYLVDPEIGDRYSLPIISLVVDPQDFFNQDTGIYVTGEDPDVVAKSSENYAFWPANYHERGVEWERAVFLEYFDEDGRLLLSQNAGVRIHGGASRSNQQKSLRLYADPKYDSGSSFDFALFPDLIDVTNDKLIESFDTFILRTGGTDSNSTYMRDVLIQRLVAHTSLDTQAIKPVLVFLNGEYWGIYYLYERYDEGYFQNHYGIDQTNIILLENEGDSVIGIDSDRGLYQELLDYVTTHDVTDAVVYAEIDKLMDIDNFIDYQITQIYIAQKDWPANNVKYWRTRTVELDPHSPYGQDGRWRWMLFDTDHGFIDPERNWIEFAVREDLPNELFRVLIENPTFREIFLNRFVDHINTTFQTDRVVGEIDVIASILEPEMQEQIDRWHSSGNSFEDWQNNVNLLRSFAYRRPEIMFQHLVEYFDLKGTYELTVTSDPVMGYVQVNSIEIQSQTPGVEDSGTFTGTYFQGVPITITAHTCDGYQFSHWVGTGVDGETNPEIVLHADGDIQLTPVFIPID